MTIKPFLCYQAQSGFSLIQISIILMIASLVMVAILPSSQTVIQTNSNTASKLNTVMIALRAYQTSNGNLPCPADASLPLGSSNYGIAAANPGATTNCSGGTPAANFVDSVNKVAIGMIPVRSLGLSNDYALDGFGRAVTYAVDTNATGCWVSSTLTGSIVITDNGAPVNSVVALISHGADGHGAWLPLAGSSGTAARLNAGATDTDELLNAHVTSSFTATGSSQGTSAESTTTTFVKKTPTATFDDLVVYKNPQWNLSSLPVGSPTPVITPPSSGSYRPGQSLLFTLTFPSAMTVVGTPQLVLSALGSGNLGIGNSVYASYASGSGTPSLTFSYTLSVNDLALLGLSLAYNLDLNGGSITSASTSSSICSPAATLSSVLVNPATLWVADTNNSLVQGFQSNGSFVNQFSTGTAPMGIAADASSNVWIGNSSQRIQQYQSNGTMQTSFGGSGSGVGQFNNPAGLAFDSSGNLWEADCRNGRIQKCTPTGSCVAYGTAGSGNGQFSTAANGSLTVDASNNVWVVDTGNQRVQKLDANGVWQMTVGGGASCTGCTSASSCSCSSGSGNGSFNSPQAAVVDSSGNLWVSDYLNNRVQKFNSGGSWVKTVGGGALCTGCASASLCVCVAGSGNGSFTGPGGMTIDASGTLWVADQGNARVEGFTAAGTWSRTIGGGALCTGCASTLLCVCVAGTGNGTFGLLNSPWNIAATAR